MEKLPVNQKSPENFHDVSKKRKDLRRAINELGIDVNEAYSDTVENSTKDKSSKQKIFEKYYKKEKEALDTKASTFKIADFKTAEKGGLTSAKEALRKQKGEHERQISKDHAQIDYEAIEKETPEIEVPRKAMQEIADLKDFRMRRMFDTLNPKVSLAVKKGIEPVLESVNEEIKENEKVLDGSDPIVLRQAELVKYKEDLAQSGHICITPSVEKDLEAIGDRMLTGKPMFLHGPTGTGKTSLARFAATHFTGETPEMVFCNPQTKESNVWGKTAIDAKRNKKGELTGAVFTYLEFGPLARALQEGRTIIFDEFTALPKEQMVFIKAIFALKPGDKVNVAGDGMIEVAPGFQAIFTANLKSEKNPERQDLPPEIAREFEQNNLKVKYTPQGEAYDIMLSRLLNRDGSLDMSFHDLNTTLPNLCKVMADIQESYTNETDKDVAKRAGAMDASGKVYSLKKFVMTQGSVEAILSSWLVEKQTKKVERSFSEFLDDRFKTALTFEEYPKEDRILVAKILASRGFLTTLSAKDIGLPEDIFTLNTIKAMRGEDAVEDLKQESGDVTHLTFKEVAELDPFGKRVARIKEQAEGLLDDKEKGKDSFSTKMQARLNKITGKEKGPKTGSVITAEYAFTNPKTKKVERKETIAIDIEEKTREFVKLYKNANVDLPPDFEETIQDIWERNGKEIQEAIEQNGFDEILIMPGDVSLPDLADKLKTKNGNYEYDNFKEGGGFVGAKSSNVDKPRIVLAHKTQNLKDRPELAQTLNIKGQDVKMDQILTLEDYLVFQKKYFDGTGKHLDEDGWTWLATKSGSRLVFSYWFPGYVELYVGACDLGFQNGALGARPSRSFF
jgi:DNA polymerase III delta prime subunit